MSVWLLAQAHAHWLWFIYATWAVEIIQSTLWTIYFQILLFRMYQRRSNTRCLQEVLKSNTWAPPTLLPQFMKEVSVYINKAHFTAYFSLRFNLTLSDLAPEEFYCLIFQSIQHSQFVFQVPNQLEAFPSNVFSTSERWKIHKLLTLLLFTIFSSFPPTLSFAHWKVQSLSRTRKSTSNSASDREGESTLKTYPAQDRFFFVYPFPHFQEPRGRPWVQGAEKVSLFHIRYAARYRFPVCPTDRPKRTRRVPVFSVRFAMYREPA